MRFAAITIALVLLAVMPGPATAQSQTKGPLILAAASLQEALTQIADRWAAQNHPRPVLSFAATSALARQIEAGAPADLFVSADQEWMDALADKRLLRAGTRANVLSNRLVLIARASSPARLGVARGFPLARALGTGRLAMADPGSVPAGRYARAALINLGVWQTVAEKVAPAENVRTALALVERGEAPFGIVYATDALASKGVRVVGTFPASSHPPIRYPLAIPRSSKHADAAAFRTFVLSAQARTVFARHGFGTP